MREIYSHFPQVTVVISTYSQERLDYVLACIRSLKEQSMQPREIILALDPGHELTDFYRKHIPPGINIVVAKNRGLSNARNAGINAAKGDVIAFIDDDATATNNWLAELVKNFGDPFVACVGGYAEPKWENHRPSWFPEELDWMVGCSYKGLPERSTEVRNPIGCNMSFRKNVFDEVGLFSVNIGRLGQHLISGEETELCIRILNSMPKSKIIYNPSAVVQHNVPRYRCTFKYLIRRSFYEGFSIAVILNDEKNSSTKVLSVETSFLDHLLRRAIPPRLKNIRYKEKFCQLATLMMSISVVLTGFIFGKLSRHNSK